MVHPDSGDQGAQDVTHRRVGVPDAHDKSPPKEKGRKRDKNREKYPVQPSPEDWLPLASRTCAQLRFSGTPRTVQRKLRAEIRCISQLPRQAQTGTLSMGKSQIFHSSLLTAINITLKQESSTGGDSIPQGTSGNISRFSMPMT